MNEQLYQDWIEALESGDYTPGTGSLYTVNKDSYCCFGVLCEISESGEWVHQEYISPNNLGYQLPDKSIEYSIPPPSLCQTIGIRHPSGPFNLTDVSPYLQNMIKKYTTNVDMLHTSLITINDTFKPNHEITQFELISAILKEKPKSMFYAHKLF